jgi:hypothetical protein
MQLDSPPSLYFTAQVIDSTRCLYVGIRERAKAVLNEWKIDDIRAQSEHRVPQITSPVFHLRAFAAGTREPVESGPSVGATRRDSFAKPNRKKSIATRVKDKTSKAVVQLETTAALSATSLTSTEPDLRYRAVWHSLRYPSWRFFLTVYTKEVGLNYGARRRILACVRLFC